MAIAVMFNNFFHDFAVAMLATSLLAVTVCCREAFGLPLEHRRRLYRFFTQVSKVAWVWILLGGAVRSWAYKEYEWLPSAGRGQVAALVLKHVLLVGILAWGIALQWKLRRELKG